MRNARTVDVAAVIESAKVSRLQIRVMLICALVIILDGFDLLVIALTAPPILAELDLPESRLGPLFGIGLLGMILGAMIVAPLGDRYGRKLPLAGSTAFFGLLSLLTATADSYQELMLLRLLTGMGLGAAVPNSTALISEYAPHRARAMMVTVSILGFAVGGLLCSSLSVPMIPAYGWRSMYVVGGLLPLIMVPVLLLWLPESVRFLASRGNRGERVAALLSRIDPAGQFAATDAFHAPREEIRGARIRQLLVPGRRHDTLLLWIMFFINMMIMFYLVNWIPYLSVRSGLTERQGALATVALNIGGIVGPLVLAVLVRRFGSRRTIASAFVVGAIACAIIGPAGAYFSTFLVVAGITGFCVFGAQIAIHALAANLYPMEIRATGIGWALGWGRVGSIIGPVAGGYLLHTTLPMGYFFAGFGALLLGAAFATWSLIFDDRMLT